MNQKRKKPKRIRRKYTWKDYNREMQIKHQTIMSPDEDTIARRKTASDLKL